LSPCSWSRGRLYSSRQPVAGFEISAAGVRFNFALGRVKYSHATRNPPMSQVSSHRPIAQPSTPSPSSQIDIFCTSRQWTSRHLHPQSTHAPYGIQPFSRLESIYAVAHCRDPNAPTNVRASARHAPLHCNHYAISSTTSSSRHESIDWIYRLSKNAIV